MASLCLGAILYQDLILQHYFAPEDKVAAPYQSSRTQLGDHYYYYILSRKAVVKFNPFAENRQEQPFFHENSGLENIYPGALLVAGLLDAIAKLAPINWNLKMVLSLVFQVGFLFATALMAYALLRRDKPVPWIELVIFGFLLAYFCRGVIYGAYGGALTYPFTTPAFYYPDFLRLVNPQMTWAYFFVYLAALILYFENPGRKHYAFIIALSLLYGLFSIVLTATVILGLGLYGLSLLARERKIDIPLLGIGIALMASFLFARYQLDLFHQSAKGINLKTGDFIGIKFKYYYFFLLVFLPLIRKYLPPSTRSPLSWLYLAALLLGAVGESFHLGGRIWLRGSGIIVHFLVIYSIVEFARGAFADYWDSVKTRSVTAIVVLTSLTVVVFYALGTKLDGWHGYIEKDKGDVIEWLRSNSSRDDVVLSADLEDAYLIPLYTNAQPYVQLFDYSPLNLEQLMRRYFRALDLSGKKQEYLVEIMKFEKQQRTDIHNQLRKGADKRLDYDLYQAHAFYSEVMYYPYNKEVEHIFSTPEENLEFDQRLVSIAADSSAEELGHIDFVIHQKKHVNKYPDGYRIRFENNLYAVLSPAGS